MMLERTRLPSCSSLCYTRWRFTSYNSTPFLSLSLAAVSLKLLLLLLRSEPNPDSRSSLGSRVCFFAVK